MKVLHSAIFIPQPVDNSAPVDTAPADTPTGIHQAAGARSSQGRLHRPPKSTMEQEKVANTHPEGEQVGDRLETGGCRSNKLLWGGV